MRDRYSPTAAPVDIIKRTDKLLDSRLVVIERGILIFLSGQTYQINRHRR